MENKPGYYANIPANVRYDSELSPTAKLLYAEITALTNAQGYCWATNSYFAVLYNLSIRHISRMISQLESKGYIKSELIYEGKEIKERRLYLSNAIDESASTPIDKNVHTSRQICPEGIDESVHTSIDKNVHTPIDRNVQDNTKGFNTTSINTKSNNKKINKKEKLDDEFESLWKLYPRKKGKDSAKKTYLKLRKSENVTYEQVRNGIEMYCKYNEFHNVEEEYIKHGSTWFNQHAWEDDYTCKPKLIKGKRHGFLGKMLNDMDNHRADIIDYGGEIINEQGGGREASWDDASSLPF